MKWVLRISLGVLGIFCFFGLFGFLALGGYQLVSELAQFLFWVCFGWIPFLFGRFSEIHVNGELLFGSLLGVICLFVVFHRLMRAFYNRSDETGKSIRTWPFRWTSAFVAILTFLFIAGISAIGITHQTVWLIQSPEPILEYSSYGSASGSSRNNLKQIIYATHNYEDSNRFLPPGSLMSSKGIPLHGWQTLLLPYIEQERLFKQIDLERSWKDEKNRGPLSTEIRAYRRPLIDPQTNEQGYALSHYAGNVQVLGGDRKRSLKDFKQGTSNTIYVGEVFANFKPWGHPLNYRDPKLGLNRSPEGFGSGNRHPTQFSMLDGSVRWFTSDIDPEFLELLSGKPME